MSLLFIITITYNSVGWSYSINLDKLKKLKPLKPAISSSYDFEKLSQQLDYIESNETNSIEEKKQFIEAEKTLHNAIEDASNILQKRLKISKKTSDRIGTLVIFSSQKYKIDPRLMLAIIKVESGFNQNAHNSYSCKFKRETNKNRCGDHSVAQINYHIWKDEFIKNGRKPLDFNRLKTDDAYAVFRMAEILNILQNNFSKKEQNWYARYHSNDPIRKKNYQAKVDKEFSKIKEINPKHLFQLISKN